MFCLISSERLHTKHPFYSRLRHERMLTDRSPFPSDPLLAGWLAAFTFGYRNLLIAQRLARQTMCTCVIVSPVVKADCGGIKKKKRKDKKESKREVVGRIVTEGYWERKELKGARRQMPPHRSTAVECRVKKKAIIWQSSASDASVYSALLTNASCCCWRRRLSLLSSPRQWSSGGARD